MLSLMSLREAVRALGIRRAWYESRGKPCPVGLRNAYREVCAALGVAMFKKTKR